MGSLTDIVAGAGIWGCTVARRHQGIPADGYNAMFKRMLDHPNITVECNREFKISNIRTIFHVGGRLGGFKYYDMDQAMAAALALPL